MRFFSRPRSAAGVLLGWAVLQLGSVTGLGQPATLPPLARTPEPVRNLRSYSGQFIVALAHGSGSRHLPGLSTNRSLVTLEPTLLTVSCERIKQLLCRELGATAPWEGKIFVVLFPAASDNDPITITCEHLKDGWQYRLEMPDVISPPRFTRTLVQLLLMEMANRTAADRSAEIPLWLAEGMTRQLQATSEKEIILPPPTMGGKGIAVSTSEVNAELGHPLKSAHTLLCAHPPLTFEQLSWATPNQYGGSDGDLYSASAQLFVQELLQLKDGRACLRAMLAELPRHYNWQLAFLRGFHPHFQRPLDTEKWWALRVVRFTGRELEQTWPLNESWEKLNAAVHAPVQLRAGPNDLPMSAEVSLQTVIREWDHPRQTQALQDRVRELSLIRQRVAREAVELTDRYRVVLETFLRDRDKTSLLLLFRKQVAFKRAAEQAVRELDALDAQRLGVRPAARSVAARDPAAR